MTVHAEHDRLEAISSVYTTREGMNARLARYGFEALQPHFTGSSCVELGPADGETTRMLVDAFDEVVAVDGSATYAEELRRRYGGREGFTAVHSLFEDWEPGRTFDTVLSTHVLEHVEDPVHVLRRAASWVAPGGVLIALVPNSRSFHRLAAVHMGLLEAPDALNETDLRIGHRRVYDLPMLVDHLEAAGLRVEATGGVFFKTLSNGQMEEWFTPAMCDAFAALGRDFPQNAAEVFAVTRPVA